MPFDMFNPFPGLGRLPIFGVFRVPIIGGRGRFGAGPLALSGAMMYQAGEGGTAGEQGGNDDEGGGGGGKGGDGSNGPVDHTPGPPDDLRGHNDHYTEPEPLRSDDMSRMNRATGVLADLTSQDRTCPASDSTARGPGDERSREIDRFLHQLQQREQAEGPDRAREPDLDAASARVRCTQGSDGCRTGFFAHSMGDPTATGLDEPIQASDEGPAEPAQYGQQRGMPIPADAAAAAFGRSRQDASKIRNIMGGSNQVSSRDQIPAGNLPGTKSDPAKATRGRLEGHFGRSGYGGDYRGGAGMQRGYTSGLRTGGGGGGMGMSQR